MSQQSEKQQQAEALLKAYETIFGQNVIKDLEDAKKKSLAEVIEKHKEEIARSKTSKREQLLDEALVTIKFQKSIAIQLASAFLNLSRDQMRWVILTTVFWISCAMLCVFVGVSIKVDCDNECQRENICHQFPDANETIATCNLGCVLENWNTSLFGIWMLDALLVVVLLVTLIISVAEKFDVCGEEDENDDDNNNNAVLKKKRGKCNHIETYKYPARLAVSLTCSCLLLGSLFGMLKLSVESGGFGFEFLKNMSWQFCFAFGYAAYIFIFFFFLLQLWVYDFDRTAKRANIKPWLAFVGNVCGILSSVMPLIFFILVGLNVDRPYGDKMDGYRLISPLFSFFILRIICSIIIPFHDCNYNGWSEEFKTIVYRSLTLCFLYLCAFVGLILAAITIESETIACSKTVAMRWIYANIPFIFFVTAMMVYSAFMMLWLVCHPEAAKQSFDNITKAVKDLMIFDDVVVPDGGGEFVEPNSSSESFNRNSSAALRYASSANTNNPYPNDSNNQQRNRNQQQQQQDDNVLHTVRVPNANDTANNNNTVSLLTNPEHSRYGSTNAGEVRPEDDEGEV